MRLRWWHAAGAGVVALGGLAALLARSGPSDARTDPRTRVASAALGELGSSDAERYWAAVMPLPDRPRDWCGAFALWALKQAGLATGWVWELGRGFLYHLPQTSEPQPGDLAYFNRNQHHAVVSRVFSDGSLEIVNGNGAGGVVTRSVVSPADVTAFFSIEPLIEA